jgi:2,3-bisphosphoglycerate-independent phosphoglycerate mutase
LRPAASNPPQRSLADEALKQSGGTCHLVGLVSPGGVHSHEDHVAALAVILADNGVPSVVHVLTDGRDTPPKSAVDSLMRLEAALPPSVPIATVIGRYYAMDRDKRWDRVARAITQSSSRSSTLPDARSAIAEHMHTISLTNSSSRR